MEVEQLINLVAQLRSENEWLLLQQVSAPVAGPGEAVSVSPFRWVMPAGTTVTKQLVVVPRDLRCPTVTQAFTGIQQAHRPPLPPD